MMVFPPKVRSFSLTACCVWAYNLTIYAQKRHILNKTTPTQENHLKTANKALQIARKSKQEKTGTDHPENNGDFATISKIEQNRTNYEIEQKSGANFERKNFRIFSRILTIPGGIKKFSTKF